LLWHLKFGNYNSWKKTRQTSTAVSTHFKEYRGGSHNRCLSWSGGIFSHMNNGGVEMAVILI
jgi:hypothetical protein